MLFGDEFCEFSDMLFEEFFIFKEDTSTLDRWHRRPFRLCCLSRLYGLLGCYFIGKHRLTNDFTRRGIINGMQESVFCCYELTINIVWDGIRHLASGCMCLSV